MLYLYTGSRKSLPVSFVHSIDPAFEGMVEQTVDTGVKTRSLFFCVLLCISLLMVVYASADIRLIGNTNYVLESNSNEYANFVLSTVSYAFDEEKYEFVKSGYVEGVTFGVYTMDSNQHLQPFPDPRHPEESLTIVSEKEEVSYYLPEGIVYYFKVLSLPAGYVLSGSDPGEFALEMPASIECKLNPDSVNGVFIQLQDDAGQPLEGVEFSLKTDDVIYSLTTDPNGRASIKDLPAGNYELIEPDNPDGYSGREESKAIFNLTEKETRLFSLVNNRNATVRLDVYERIVARNGEEERIVSTKAYDLYDADGNRMLTVYSGDIISLPAAPAGTAYSIRASSDGEETLSVQDNQNYPLLLKSGDDTELSIVLDSDYGDFIFSQALNGEAIPGGTYMLTDAAGNQLTTFEPDEEGRFVSPMLKSGIYTVTQTKAADGCVYTGDAVQITIKPYLPDKGDAAWAFYELRSLPDELLEPLVYSDCREYESLFDSDANIEVGIELLNDFTGWNIENVEVSWNVPDIPGISMSKTDEMHVKLHLGQRVFTPESVELDSLQMTGTVSYQILYPVDGNETIGRLTVSETFEVTPAVFSPPKSQCATRYGQVIDENGNPLEGICVSICDGNGRTWETVTDIFGTYGFIDAPKDLPLQAKTDENHGFVTYDNQIVILPLTSVTVSIEANKLQVPFEIVLSIDGCEELLVQDPGGYTLTGVISEDSELSVACSDGVLWDLSRQADGNYKLTLLPESVVSGRVCYWDGTPAEGMNVMLSDGSSTVTTADGRFTFKGLTAGEYLVIPEIPESVVAAGEETIQIDLGIGETETVEFILMEPATVVGQLIGRSEIVSNVSLTLDPGAKTTTTDSEGRFVISGLSLGTYRISAATDKNAVLENTSFQVKESGETIEVRPSFIIPATITGVIWRDTDDDGYLTEDDGVLNGVSIELLTEDGQSLQRVYSQSDGSYEISGIAAGTYTLQVTLPDGLIFSKRVENVERVISGVDQSVGMSAPITLAEGERIEDLNIGAVTTGTIHGLIWLDSNANGVKDDDESAYSEAIVVISSSDGVYEQTVTTDVNGRYSFDSIRLGNYDLKICVGEGHFFTRQRAGTALGSDVQQVDQNIVHTPVEIRAWHDTEEVNAGIVKTVSMKVQVWIDSDANGSRASSETGFPQVSVKLYNADGSVQRLLEERQTDSEGCVVYEKLRPGKYAVRAVKPETYVNTTDTAISFTLLENHILYFGFTKAGNVAGIVFEDSDNDGIRNEDETGIRAKVELLNASTGESVMEVRSQQDGHYQFDDILPGKYLVRFTLDENWRFSSDYRSDAASYNSDVRTMEQNVGTTNVFYVPMSEQVLVDAGAYQTGSITGKIWIDTDENGAYARSENGLDRTVIRLIHGQEVVVEEKTKDDGLFAFENLSPADYTMEVVLPENYFFTTGGAIPGVDSNTGIIQAIHVSGDKTELNIGAVELAKISGHCEQSGVTVMVYRNDEITAKTITDKNGDYSIDKLRPGLLRIEFYPEAEYTMAVEGEERQEVRIKQGEIRSDINAKVIRGAILTGSVWLDADWDGIRSEGESIPDDLTVVLTSTTGYTLSQIPDQDGTFRFVSLRPGRYEISYDTETALTDAQLPLLTTLEEGATIQVEPTAFYLPATISGTVWDDLDSNNRIDTGESGVESVKVIIQSVQTGTVLAETTTDQEGKYRIEDLMPGAFVIRFNLPAGFIMTDENESDRTVELVMGESLDGEDVSVLRSGTVGDTVWIDENRNGIQDTGEPGMSDVTVQVWRESDTGEWVLVSEVTTDINGHYRARDIRPGTIKVSFGSIDSYLPTEVNEGFPEFNSKVVDTRDGYWWTDAFKLLSGEKCLNLDAGVIPVLDHSLQTTDAEIDDDPAGLLPDESGSETSAEPLPNEAEPVADEDSAEDNASETPSPSGLEGEPTEDGEVFFF